ncbi:MAG TPA: CHAT domain-containing protein [Gemmatimonadaceae bacterium]
MRLAHTIPIVLAAAISAAASAAALPAQGAATDAPADIVRAATEAVRADTAARLRGRWEARLRRDSSDRAATLGLATISRLTFAYDDAERRFRRLFAEGAPRDGHRVHARIGLALAKEAQGESGERVFALYRPALADARALGDTLAEGEALYRTGSLLAPFAGAGPSLVYLDSAMRTLPGRADGLRAAVRCRRAQIFVATARPGDVDTLALAMQAARTSGDLDALGNCLRATVVLHQLRGQGDSATAAQLALIDLRRRMRDRSGLAVALTIRADHLRRASDFGGALRLFREALAEARASGNRYIEATVSLGLGANALSLNDHESARAHIDEAVAAFRAADDSASLMLALSFRPFVSIAAGALDDARRQTTELLAYWQRHGDWVHVNDLWRQLAVIEMRRGDYEASARALDEAEVAARRVQSPGSLGAVAYDRGRLALLRGDLAAAERGFARFVESVDTTDRLLRYDGRLRLAEVYARRGELARAEAEMTAAGDALDAWRATLTDPEMRALAFQASSFEANDRNASVAVVVAALARGGRARAAFEIAEARRARDLAERLARARALADGDASTDGGDDADDGAKTRPARAGAPTGTLALAEIARLLPDDETAILEYVTGTTGAPTTLFVVRRAAAGAAGTVEAHVLPSADSLVGDISRLVGLIEGGDDPEALERRLAAALLDSAVAALPPAVRRLVVVPDGPLHRVPWDALRLADGRWAAERFAVSIAPSASVVAALWRSRARDDARDAGRSPARVLAFGDPAFANERAARPDEAVYRSAFAETGGLPRLPHSAREARLVARFAPGGGGDVRLREEASAWYLRHAELEPYDVLHFATHALVDERVATRTALALSAGGGESGFVGAAELASLDLDAALVVLSACRSAGGVVVDGEGVQGLTAPLLEAGARSVVATTWRIGDRGAVPLVDALYRGLARGLPLTDALREAKLDAMRRGAPPAEWAAFTAVGDPLVRVALVEPPPRVRWWIVAVAAFAVALLAFVVALARRRRAPP